MNNSWFNNNPIVLVRMDSEFSEKIASSRRGYERFSFTQKHSEIEGVRSNSLCLFETRKDDRTFCYIGILKHRSAVATVDSRMTFHRLVQLSFLSFDDICRSLTDIRLSGNFRTKLNLGQIVTLLSPKLSIHIVETLRKLDSDTVDKVMSQIVGFRDLTELEFQEKEAIDLAKSVFGISPDALSHEEQIDAKRNPWEENPYLWEDNVIAKDSSQLDVFDLIEKTLTGRSTFRKDGEELTIFTANRTLLEKMLGVDLIYVNETRGNIVMVQHKMLQRTGDGGTGDHDWILRPDKQLEKEIERMVLPPTLNPIDGYRIHSDPFFFKFIKRRSDKVSQSIVITRDHLTNLLKSPDSKGVRGVRVGFNSLQGTYLRDSDLICLIRCGYIGTFRSETKALRQIIARVACGDRAFVIAWQQKTARRVSGVSKVSVIPGALLTLYNDR